MKGFEVFFDSLYLTFVLFIGIRLLFVRKEDSGLIGTMVLLLGLGDSFHLIPRIISNVAPGGFAANADALFFGTRVSAWTMSLFYLLFYYYIRREARVRFRMLDVAMPLLFVFRMAIVLLSFSRSYRVDLISNIPFLLMGLIDFILLYRERDRVQFGRLYLYVLFSFLFYVPVVLLKNVYPSIGMLMMPKTIMYVLMVWKLYGNLKDTFDVSDLVCGAGTYLMYGVLAGAFYREVGKIYPVEPSLAFLHVHLIVLGFVLPTLFYLLVKEHSFENRCLKNLSILYNFGMFFSFGSMFLHGLLDGYTLQALVRVGMVSMSGVGHILLTIAFIKGAAMGLKAVEI
ncbi:MAG: DUF2871 family protein [Peptoniphilus sp.]|nr:DUF2871 family protein [Peptoniphilus sp.]MDY3117987.1 DUF2871 family protein [Peptoniphilus sp.]